MTTLNVDLLDQTLAYLKEHPEEHNQSWWATKTPCGTTRCVAGTVAHLTGAEPIWEPWFDGRQDIEAVIDPDTGDRVPVSGYAAEKLGLTWSERRALFGCGNDEVFQIAADIKLGLVDHEYFVR